MNPPKLYGLAVAAALVTIALGLLARASLTGLPAKVLGVALYATLVYWVVVCVAPALPVGRVSLVALALCFAVELAQLTPIPAALSARHPLLRLVFGTTFSAWDLPMYAAGVLLAAALHRLALRRMAVPRSAVLQDG